MDRALTHQSIILPDGDAVTFKITNRDSEAFGPRATLWIDAGTYHGVQITFCNAATMIALRAALNSADADMFMSAEVTANA